jgi:6-phosphogluconolactonase
MGTGAAEIRVFPDPPALSGFAADLFSKIARDSVAQRGRFLTVLSGGGTPLALYRLLALPPFRDDLPWEQMHFFWGDERCVPPEDPGSNYRQAYEPLLLKVPVPTQNIHRARGELSPASAAEDYARQLREFAAPRLDYPRFDLVLLGLGADGHTASLFPQLSPHLSPQMYAFGGRQEGGGGQESAPVLAVTADYQGRPANRVTLTPPVFNAARDVLFLVTGEEKAAALAATVQGPRDPLKYPAQRIQPAQGKVWWLVDEQAAHLLPEQMEEIRIQR